MRELTNKVLDVEIYEDEDAYVAIEEMGQYGVGMSVEEACENLFEEIYGKY